MQQKFFLALFCIIAVFLITVNDGAPAAPKVAVPPTVAPSPPPAPVKPAILPGAPTPWTTKIDSRSKKLFKDYIKVISKKLQATHKVAPTFKPKPAKVKHQLVSGTLYNYLVKLPTNKYAYVTIVHRPWKKGEYGNEQHVTVKPGVYGLNDENI